MYRSELIKKIQPWLKSTGPKSDEGKSISSQNALKHGVRSKNTIAVLKTIRGLIKSTDSIVPKRQKSKI